MGVVFKHPDDLLYLIQAEEVVAAARPLPGPLVRVRPGQPHSQAVKGPRAWGLA